LPSALAEKDGAARRAAPDVCLTIRIAQKEGGGGGNSSTNSPPFPNPQKILIKTRAKCNSSNFQFSFLDPETDKPLNKNLGTQRKKGGLN